MGAVLTVVVSFPLWPADPPPRSASTGNRVEDSPVNVVTFKPKSARLVDQPYMPMRRRSFLCPTMWANRLLENKFTLINPN